MKLAQRLERITEPQTIKMAKLGRALKAQGHAVIDLSIGEPDFKTPDHICEAAAEAMKKGYTRYTPVAGIAELRQAIRHKFQRDNDLSYEVDEILVSTGAKQSLANAILSLVNPGDEVLIPAPYWVTYKALVDLAEGQPRILPTTVENQYKLQAEDLEKSIQAHTRLFIFSSPCNPSGSVYSQQELAALVEVFKKHPQVWIISDEIYEYIQFQGAHHSIAQFSEIRDRVLVVNGMSKGFAMTGWRIGYMAGPRPLIQAAEKLQAQFTSGANSIAQWAAVAALSSDLGPTQAMCDAFKARSEFVYEALRSTAGVKISPPQGAFYAFPDMSAFLGTTEALKTDEDLCLHLLHEAHVATVAGSAFGQPGCLRISFANSMENLEAAMDRIKTVLGKIPLED